MIGKEIVKWTKWFYRALVVWLLVLFNIGPWYYISGYKVYGHFGMAEFMCSVFIIIGLIMIVLSFAESEGFFSIALVVNVIVLVAFVGLGIYFPVADKYVMSKNWWLITIISGLLLVAVIIGKVFERKSSNEELVEVNNIGTRIAIVSGYGIITLIIVIVSIVVANDKGWKLKDDTLYIEREIGIYVDDTLWGKGSFSRLKVEEGVKILHQLGLEFNEDNMEVDLPDSLEVIGEYAFFRCNNLKEINIPKNVKTIEYDAFYECKNLTKINFSQNLEIIGFDAFSGCVKLVSINLPESLKEIESDAFKECKKLKEFYIPKNVKAMGQGAFEYCEKVVKVEIASDLKIIEEYTFYGCKELTSVKLPDSLKEIGYGAFGGCDNLRQITIPENVNKIGNKAFSEHTRLIVARGSYAEKWAIENGYRYETY